MANDINVTVEDVREIGVVVADATPIDISVTEQVMVVPIIEQNISVVAGGETAINVTVAEATPIVIQGEAVGPAIVPESEMVTAKRVDWSADGLTLYKGEAAPGAADADPVWRIFRRVFNDEGDFVETWADGTAVMGKIWDDHLTLSYS